MKTRTFVLSAMAGTLMAIDGAGAAAQETRSGTADTVDAHVAAAKALAANEQTALINLCEPSASAAASRSSQPARGAQPPAPPDRSQWTREPMKVFDNLYYVGEKEYSSWAVVTSAGIIIIDAIYDYSVEEQVAGGLKKLGLDPANIKYVVVSHAHRDHVGGAWFLQERYGARALPLYCAVDPSRYAQKKPAAAAP